MIAWIIRCIEKFLFPIEQKISSKLPVPKLPVPKKPVIQSKMGYPLCSLCSLQGSNFYMVNNMIISSLCTDHGTVILKQSNDHIINKNTVGHLVGVQPKIGNRDYTYWYQCSCGNTKNHYEKDLMEQNNKIPQAGWEGNDNDVRRI